MFSHPALSAKEITHWFNTHPSQANKRGKDYGYYVRALTQLLKNKDKLLN